MVSNTNVNSTEIEDNMNLEGKESILVVDDEVALLSLAYEILSNHGYKVFSAEGAKQALEILEKESIDILFSDVIMPDVDGYELAAVVNEKYPSIKVQLVSGFSGENNIAHIDNELSKNLLQKPYTMKSLLKKIHDLLK